MRHIIFIFLLTVFGAVHARGAAFSTNLVGNPPFDEGNGTAFGDVISVHQLANGFQASITGQLGYIRVPISLLSMGGSDLVTLYLTEDDSFSPGNVIESFSERLSLFGEPGVLLTIQSMSHPLLSAGSVYWLVAELDPDAIGVWMNPNFEDNGPIGSLAPGSQTWDTLVGPRNAFSLNEADAVPEGNLLTPSACFLFAVVLWKSRIAARGIGAKAPNRRSSSV